MIDPTEGQAIGATTTRAKALRTGPKLGALFLLSLGTACGSSAAPATPGASPQDENEPVALRFGAAAPTVDYWPLFVAQDAGIFVKHGLQVEVTHFETPATVIQALTTNAVDVCAVATDLAINAVERGLPVITVAGITNKATYSLVAARRISAYADLRGQTLAVSDVKVASTLLLRKMLKGQGLADGDYDVIPMGGSSRRAAAIASGQAAGALLGPPTNFALEEDGYLRLGLTTDVLPDYQFNALHVQRPWAQANRQTLVRLLRAMIDATTWLYDPAHREEAIAIMVARFKVSPEIGGRTYDLAVSRLQVFSREAELSPEGMTAVLETMADMELIGRPVPGVAKYVDDSYLALAGKGA